MKQNVVRASLYLRLSGQRLRRAIKLFLEKRRYWTGFGWRSIPFAVHELRGTGRLFECHLGGERLWVRAGTTDFVVAWSNLRGGEFESIPTNLSVKESSLIIDAGAYIGTSSLALNRLFPKMTILALEPHPDNFEVLSRNVSGVDNIIPLNVALSDSDETVQLRDPGQGEYGYSVLGTFSKVNEEWPVAAVSIGSLLRRFDADRVLILKLDIEGAEVRVLSKGIESLSKVDCLVAELHDFLDSRCTDSFLAATQGMTVSGLDGEKAVAVRPSAIVSRASMETEIEGSW